MFDCRALIKLFYPVRSNALNYMSQLSDGELRAPTSRHMANLLWSSGREHFMDASNAGSGLCGLCSRGGVGSGTCLCGEGFCRFL